VLDLPEKIRQEAWLELDDDQRAAYDEVLVTGQRVLSENVETENEFQVRRHIFALLQELKQICNFAPKRSESAKTEALLDIVQTIAENEEKVLIFTQFVDYGVSKLERFFKDNFIKSPTKVVSTHMAPRWGAVSCHARFYTHGTPLGFGPIPRSHTRVVFYTHGTPLWCSLFDGHTL
jgi:hypothetical protein